MVGDAVPRTLLYVARGVLGVPSLQGRSEPFTVGESGTGWLLLFHVIPLSRHTIEVVAVDVERHAISTHEHGGLLRTWNHTLQVEQLEPTPRAPPTPSALDAGAMTPVVARVATAIFRHRQRRWHRLARRHLTQPDATGTPT